MISVVIPNYNGKHFLKICIESLLNQSYKDIEIIMVDNNSSDGSREFINKFYPSVKVLSLDYNSGFSPAVNFGIEAAKGEFVFLLNNDTELERDCIKRLFDFSKGKENLFSVGAKMIQYNNRNYIDDAGDEYNLFGWAFKRGFNQLVTSNKDDRRVFSCCAGAALYKTDILRKIGGFDNAFFAYLEDVDIGYRANCYGYKNYYCSSAVVYHIISGTSGNKKSEFKTMLSARNNIYLIYKNMPFAQLMLNLPTILIGILVKSIFFIKHGFGKVYLIESFKAIKNFKKMKKTRFEFKNILHYLWIQIRLFENVFLFLKERIVIAKNKKLS